MEVNGLLPSNWAKPPTKNLILKDDSDALFELRALFNYVTTGNDSVTPAGVNLPRKHTNGSRFTRAVRA